MGPVMPVSGGLFAFGLYTVDHPKIISTFTALQERLRVKTEIGGMARYEDDSYMRIHPSVTGNPWFVCTLWLADYLIEKAQNEKRDGPGPGNHEVGIRPCPAFRGLGGTDQSPDRRAPLGLSPHLEPCHFCGVHPAAHAENGIDESL